VLLDGIRSERDRAGSTCLQIALVLALVQRSLDALRDGERVDVDRSPHRVQRDPQHAVTGSHVLSLKSGRFFY